MFAPEIDPVLSIFWGIMSVIFGLVCGSFFNVCIYRVPAKKSIVFPPSHCYSCGTYLAWYDNIPLLSYLMLRGNCRYCGSHFSPRYFLIELLTGALFLAVYLQFGPGWIVPFHVAFVGLLIIGTFTDIDHYILPDGITIGGLVFALVTAAILGKRTIVYREFLLARELFFSFWEVTPHLKPAGHWWALGWAAASAVFGWAMLAGVGAVGRILFRKEAMGGGDIKLFAFLGAYLGAINCVWILFLSAVLGTCFGLTFILMHMLFKKDEFEDIELVPVQGASSRMMSGIGAGIQRDNIEVGETHKSGAEVLEQTGDDSPISIRVARTTSRQLHHFPFGPYIAAAALLVLLFSHQLSVFTRSALLLPPESRIELYRPSAPAHPPVPK